MSGHCHGPCLSDDEAIEVVELLCLAKEMCKTADGFVSVALERVSGTGADTYGLRRDAARLVAMLSPMARSVEPTTWDQP